MVEGTRGVREALNAGAVQLLLREQGVGDDLVSDGVDVETVSSSVMEAMSDTSSPPGVIAVCRFLDVPSERIGTDGSFLVGVGVSDPGNAGTLIRSAAAAGFEAVVLSEGSVDVYNPKVVRASGGGIFRVTIARDCDVYAYTKSLAASGVKCVAADTDGDRQYWDADLSGRVAIVVGNEAWGISVGLLEMMDERVVIPMPGGTESLNVGVAGSLLIYEALRQRRS